MKVKSLLLGIVMLLGMASAWAQGGTTGPLTWNINNGTLTISGNGAMPDYGSGEAPWFDYRESITTVVIENGVTTIGDYAFYYCRYSLTSITLPNSVTTIGDGAFSSCLALKSIILPNSVTTIGDRAFRYCLSLPSITIPNSVKTIGEGTFSYCSSLPSITLPNSVTTIGDEAFTYCSKLTSITLPNSVTTIGASAFSFCSKLPSITLPNSVTTIGDRAFEYCRSLTSITLPNSVTTIGDKAFYYCFALTSIEVESGNANYSSDNGVLFDKAKNLIICYPAGKTDTNYTPPNSVTTIGNAAFLYCSALTSITLPNSVTTIGNVAFLYCSALTSITLPNSLTTIGNGAFSDCSSLTSITNLNPVPVDISSLYLFAAIYINTITLTVPTSAVSAYQNAAVWQRMNIVGGGILVNPVSNNIKQGYTTGDALYQINETATVAAIAYSGCKFINWTKDGAVISTDNPYSFTVTEDVELVANFEGGAGIETIESDVMSVYPNPTHGELQIKNYELGIRQIQVFDVMGRMVMVAEPHGRAAQQDATTTLDISHLPAGIYFLQIQTETGTVTKKVMKQ